MKLAINNRDLIDKKDFKQKCEGAINKYGDEILKENSIEYILKCYDRFSKLNITKVGKFDSYII